MSLRSQRFHLLGASRSLSPGSLGAPLRPRLQPGRVELLRRQLVLIPGLAHRFQAPFKRPLLDALVAYLAAHRPASAGQQLAAFAQ